MGDTTEIEQSTRSWWKLPPGSELPTSVNTLVSLFITLVIVAAFILAIGANPWDAGRAIVEGSLTKKLFLGQTLMIASILALTGLAAALPFTSRLWNIGGEGQMFAGAIVAVSLGIKLPEGTPRPLFIAVILVGSFIGGGFWGFIAGALKAWFGASEIVTTLMLSFIAIFIANYIIADVWPDPFSQKTVSIHDNAQFPEIWQSANVDISVIIAIVAAGLAWMLMRGTALGFSIRAIGANPNAARLAGVSTSRVTILTFFIAGGFAGLAGSVAVAGIFDDLDINFSSNFGFLGIAVALLARLNPPLIIPAAFLFAMLRVGSNSLQAAADISPSLGDILVSVFVILLMVTGAIRFRYAQNVTN